MPPHYENISHIPPDLRGDLRGYIGQNPQKMKSDFQHTNDSRERGIVYTASTTLTNGLPINHAIVSWDGVSMRVMPEHGVYIVTRDSHTVKMREATLQEIKSTLEEVRRYGNEVLWQMKIPFTSDNKLEVQVTKDIEEILERYITQKTGRF